MTQFNLFKVKAPKGVNFSLEPSQLNPDTWDSAENVAFRHGRTMKCSGHEQGLGYGRAQAEVIIPLRDKNQSNYWWSYIGDKLVNQDGSFVTQKKVYRVFDKNNHQDVTPEGGITPPVGYWDNRITGDSINGIPYYTYEVPYVWDASAEKFIKMNKFPNHLTFSNIKTFKNFLVGMNFHTTSALPGIPGFSADWTDQTHQSGVWWTHNIDKPSLLVGDSEKSLWCDADANRNSGWVNLGGSGGPILDGLTLGNSFIIYRENSVWQMDLAGGSSVMNFREIFSDVGILNANCAVDVDGKHFVVGHSDIYYHNGHSKQSISDNIITKEIFSNIDENHYKNVFATVNYDTKEFIVCVPQDKGEGGYTGACNTAYVFNYAEGVWSKKDLPDVLSASYTILSVPNEIITYEAERFQAGVPGSSYGEQPESVTYANLEFKYSTVKWGLVYGSSRSDLPNALDWDDDKDWKDSSFWDEDLDQSYYAIYTVQDDALFDGVNFTATMTKRWVDMDDNTKASFVNKIYPEVRKGPVVVHMAGTYRYDESPVYQRVGTFDPTLQERLDCRISGNYIHTRFTIPETSRAEISGYSIEFSKIGRR